MAYTLRIPLTQTFHFKVEQSETGFEELVECDLDENPDCFVTFRQATAADAEARTQAVSRRTYRAVEDGGMLLIDDTNMDAVGKLEIMLTLADTDILLPDGKRMSFTDTNGVRRVKDRQEFQQWWDTLYPHWAAVLSDCCLKVNLNWSPKRGF